MKTPHEIFAAACKAFKCDETEIKITRTMAVEMVRMAQEDSGAANLLSALQILVSAYKESIKLSPSRDCYLDSQIGIAELAIKNALPEQTIPIQTEKLWSNSSTVAKTSYKHQEQQLFVEFTNGKQYQYNLFPADEWLKLLQAESIGKYLHAHVKGNYEGISLN